jgi:3-phytase
MRLVVLLGGLLLAGNLFAAPLQIRVATYNASLNRTSQGQLVADLSTTTNAHAKKVAEILQRVRPDIVLVNEFDVDPTNPTAARDLFHTNYLTVSQNGQAPLSYPYRYAAPSNTGVPSMRDLDNNGSVTTTPGSEAYGNDSFGFGEFSGKYSFAVYSRFPIQTAATRSFQTFRWLDMPNAVYPPGWYDAGDLEVFRLSSKNHVDLRIEIKPGQVVQLLASHPTPPSFDTAEDRNGRRNHDEIRFWADYVSNALYIYDDQGGTGGLGPDAQDQRFIILGDMNADPLDGDSFQFAINQLRNHPLINAAPNPSSLGGPQQSQLQGGKNLTHVGNPAYDTADFGDTTVGNLRVDHVLPSKTGFSVAGSGVFWPLQTDPTFALVNASDHRLVWLDLVLTPVLAKAVRNLKAVNAGPDIQITWGTQAGVSYAVEWSTDLTTWFDSPALPITFDAVKKTAVATDTASVEKKFYRVRVTLEQ